MNFVLIYVYAFIVYVYILVTYFKQLLPILIYFKMQFIPVTLCQSWIFSFQCHM